MSLLATLLPCYIVTLLLATIQNKPDSLLIKFVHEERAVKLV